MLFEFIICIICEIGVLLKKRQIVEYIRLID